jgi:hypothetical protein
LNQIRRGLLERVHAKKRLQRRSRYTNTDEQISTIEAACTVLKDWYRCTHHDQEHDKTKICFSTEKKRSTAARLLQSSIEQRNDVVKETSTTTTIASTTTSVSC